MNTYLITGGAGVLGSHLVKRLLEEGNEVVVLDNLSSSDGTNLDPFMGLRNFHYHFHDVRNSFEGIMDQYDLDGIFNLACPASPPFYQNMPIETTLTSVLGAHHALELATERHCRILQTSTSEVYGDPEISPQPETYRGKVNCFGPRACYDEGKRAAEALFYDYQKQNQTDIRVVRIFNTYGPNMLANDGRVVSNFINQALKNEDITIYGEGNQSRSFCYVNDLIEALLTIWNSNYTSPVNIGNPGEYTMFELAKKIIDISGSKSDLSYWSLPIDDPVQRCPDITLAKSLGWGGPKIELDLGLASTIQYFGELQNRKRV